MSNSDWNQRIRQEVDQIQPDDVSGAKPSCQGSDLKGLLNSIVDQISEADRRNCETLRQMQDKIGSMGREASSIRSRVPEQFAAAFERIEAGMAELAARVADAGATPKSEETNQHFAAETLAQPASLQPASHQPSSHRAPASQASHDVPPMALRSAVDPNAPPPRRREENVGRAQNKVDTFDVIESSLPGDASDPWDRESAEALSDIYESSGVTFATKPAATAAGLPQPAAFISQGPVATAAAPGVDAAWLETRFSEITTRIEQSLADISPDQSFFSLSQRLEQFERQFNSAIDSVATKTDVEGVRLIEAHISEIAGHLEDTHGQLVRLDAIEHQLNAISEKLGEVHRVAIETGGSTEGGGFAPQDIDVHAVAKAAAEQAASHFAGLQPKNQSVPGIDEVRGLIERLMSECRQGDENTNALLDTLQQAMIRLLDRVDAIEVAQHQSAIDLAAQFEQASEHAHFGTGAKQQPPKENTGALDAAVAAVASAKAMGAVRLQAAEFEDNEPTLTQPAFKPNHADDQEPETARQPDRIRQDFIADARRAKMRLAAENASTADAAVLKSEGADRSAPVKAPAPASKAPPAKVKVKDQTDRGSAMSPRVMAVAIAALVAAGGYMLLPFGSGPEVASIVTPLPAPAAATAKPGKSAVANPDAMKPSAGTGDAPAVTPEGGPDTLKRDSGTRGEIDPTGSLTVGSMTVPLTGVAIDADKPFNTAEVQRSKRQQAMAAMSGKLGQSVADGNGLAFPAAAHPDKDSSMMGTFHSSVAKNGMSETAALDMPPATVGPQSLRLAAANGDPSAEFEVGARLAEGKGTDQSFKDAAKWYQRSASRGFVQAQYRLGTLFERGLGMKADLARAEDWYKRAAEQGNVKAMHNLAVLSTSQSKGTPDYQTAAKWFGQAAEHGLSDSQFNLAVLHENGLGVPQDLKSAYMWLSLAARAGDKEAVRRRDILKGKLTADELGQAENMISMFRPTQAEPMANDARTAGEAWKKNPSNGVNG